MKFPIYGKVKLMFQTTNQWFMLQVFRWVFVRPTYDIWTRPTFWHNRLVHRFDPPRLSSRCEGQLSHCIHRESLVTFLASRGLSPIAPKRNVKTSNPILNYSQWQTRCLFFGRNSMDYMGIQQIWNMECHGYVTLCDSLDRSGAGNQQGMGSSRISAWIKSAADDPIQIAKKLAEREDERRKKLICQFAVFLCEKLKLQLPKGILFCWDVIPYFGLQQMFAGGP